MTEIFHVGSVAWISLFWGMLGAFIGSFLGVVIERLPKEQSIIWGRSHCDYCKKNLRWFELIPVVSFFFQGGKCARCHKVLSWRYPALELFTGGMFAILWMAQAPLLLPYTISLGIACSLLVIVVIDFDHMIIPDVLVGITSLLAFLYAIFTRTSVIEILKNNLVTGIVCYLLFYGLWYGTKKKGIGFGDVKLAFALGLLMGFPRVIIGLYGAFLTGAFVAIILVLHGKKTMKSAVPFGPFLVLGAVISFLVDAQYILSFIL